MSGNVLGLPLAERPASGKALGSSLDASLLALVVELLLDALRAAARVTAVSSATAKGRAEPVSTNNQTGTKDQVEHRKAREAWHTDVVAWRFGRDTVALIAAHTGAHDVT